MDQTVMMTKLVIRDQFCTWSNDKNPESDHTSLFPDRTCKHGDRRRKSWQFPTGESTARYHRNRYDLEGLARSSGLQKEGNVRLVG